MPRLVPTVLLLLLPLPGAGPPAPAGADTDPAGQAGATGIIEGTVVLDRKPARRVPRRYPGGEPGAASTVQEIEPVVFLRGPASGDGSEPSPRTRTMAQSDTTFRPSLLVVRPGDVVEFPNRDSFFHNVFSYSDPARFDLGRYPRGRSKSVTFTEPGIVRIYCEVHDFMRAAVVVTENPHHARPDADGRFRMDGVPPGRYTVVGWDPDRGTVAEEVTVPEGGRVRVRLDLS